MSWCAAGASVIGTAHLARGSGCDDAFHLSIAADRWGEPVLVALVSDGAGSASRSAAGARHAVDLGGAYLTALAACGHLLLGEPLARALALHVHDGLEDLAQREGTPIRDLACTFLALVATAQEALAIQIGDGAIVVDTGEALELALEPARGEYVNTTVFVTDARAAARPSARHYGHRLQAAALLSDGLEPVALERAASSPFEPFFARLFATLKANHGAEREQLSAGVEALLGSTAVNARTDDDKTLVLAQWCS